MEIQENLYRFGQIAKMKGFITNKQYIKAQNIQIKEKLENEQPRPIGEILFELGYLTQQQIEEVLNEINGARK